MSTVYSLDDVSKHNTPESLWLVVDSEVYDVTKFAKFHPGGATLLYEFAGKDCTKDFFALHRMEVLQKYERFKIGSIKGESKKYAADQFSEFSMVPYAERPAFMGLKNPYYTESHKKFALAVRKFIAKEIKPFASQYEAAGKYPTIEMYQKMGAVGLLAARLSPGPHMVMLEKAFGKGEGNWLVGGVKAKDFDYFHEAIVHGEFQRMGTPAFSDGLGAGMVIGLPPVLVFGKPELQQRVVPEVLFGQKRIALAISEAFAGSDVAQIRTTAKLSADGTKYIVNGTKKWITNAAFADYFVTAVRTGGDGAGGISVLFIERSKGLTTTQMNTSYGKSAGTAFITFDNVEVPVENLLGKENKGSYIIFSNFNAERQNITLALIAGLRIVVEECFKWANQREVFGKPLIAQPVIRQKLAAMVGRLEAVSAWADDITYNMNNMDYREQSLKLGGPIALCKFEATRAAHEIADNAVQIFGGRAITATGLGDKIEALQRTYKFAAILGGSEEILADLGIRQAQKSYPSHARL